MDILIEEYQENIWAVALKDGRIDALEIDPINEHVRWGSVYWAKVGRVDKALDAVFVDLDGDCEGILYNKDVRYTDENGIVRKGGDQAIGKVLSPGMMIAVQAKSTYINSEESEWAGESKITQVSMDITIQGRYLIYGVMMEQNRISGRIHGKKVRHAVELMLDDLQDVQGFILRSSAADVQTEILRREAGILQDIWLKISAYFTDNEPALIALGPDSIQRIMSDAADQPIDKIEVVTMDHFEQAEDWCQIFAPDLVTKIKPLELDEATQDLALFEHYDILGQIEALFHQYILLSRGGNIIIQETAALTAIDINSGGDKRGHHAVNIDAIDEIGRQIKLRNIGGVIIIDFLKSGKKEQTAILEKLKMMAMSDPCTIQIHGFTKLGLVEITRNRRTAPLQDRFDGFSL